MHPMDLQLENKASKVLFFFAKYDFFSPLVCPFWAPVRMGMCIRMPRLKKWKNGIYGKKSEYKTSNGQKRDPHLEKISFKKIIF